MGARGARGDRQSDRPPLRDSCGQSTLCCPPRKRVRSNEKGIDTLSYVSISEDASPVVRLVHSTVYDALRAGASDIHLESTAAGLVVRYRVDGVLANIATVAGVELSEQVISRIKVMSELDIAERRVPQDGRFKIAYRRTADRFPRVDHSQRLRRGCRAARTRQEGADRADERAAARCVGIRRGRRWRAAPPERAPLRHAARHRADRQRQDHDPLCGDLGNADRAGTRSSPSRIRWSTNSRACCRFR